MEIIKFNGEQLVSDTTPSGPCDCLCVTCDSCTPQSNIQSNFQTWDIGFL